MLETQAEWVKTIFVLRRIFLRDRQCDKVQVHYTNSMLLLKVMALEISLPQRFYCGLFFHYFVLFFYFKISDVATCTVIQMMLAFLFLFIEVQWNLLTAFNSLNSIYFVVKIIFSDDSHRRQWHVINGNGDSQRNRKVSLTHFQLLNFSSLNTSLNTS